MNSIDPTSNGLFYNATQAAQNQLAADAARRKEKEQKIKKPIFSSMMQKNTEQNSLVAAGLPPEIAGMNQEEAFVFLKDRLDSAGDTLSQYASTENFDNYKKAVSQFIKYLEKNNYTLKEHKLPRRMKPRKNGDTIVQIQAINEKLDRLAYEIWYNHLDKLKLLSKIKEINGLVIDLTAV